MDEKEIRKEMRSVHRRESDLLLKYRYAKKIDLESLLGKFLPKDLEETLNAAFREAFRVIFAKGTPVISRTFNERKLWKSEGEARRIKEQWAKDMVLTSVEGAGLGLLGVGVPDIALFTGMLLRTVYLTASSYRFEYQTKTEQFFILKLIEAAFARGRQAEILSDELDALMRRIDEEDYSFYGSMRDQIAKTSRALSDEMMYLKFLQTVPVVGIAGGIFNPVYMNRIKRYSDVKYRKRWLWKKQRALHKTEK